VKKICGGGESTDWGARNVPSNKEADGFGSWDAIMRNLRIKLSGLRQPPSPGSPASRSLNFKSLEPKKSGRTVLKVLFVSQQREQTPCFFYFSHFKFLQTLCVLHTTNAPRPIFH